MRGPAYEEVLRRLYARANVGIRLGLERMRTACAAWGNPEESFESVHIAGTNGKGSASAMVESILRGSGRRTGLFTSPHLCRFSERIRIAGDEVDGDRLAAVLGEVLERGPDLTFFEATTLAAFRVFQQCGVDAAVLEVGLGGRLDATNVITAPRATAITRIAFDHMDQLGETLPEIAREKAGIAKKSAPLVIGPMDPSAERAIRDTAERAGARVVRASSDRDAVAFAETGMIGLDGDHQKDNAKVAHVIGRWLGHSLAECARGIRETQWPGRLERVLWAKGIVLLDAAHNEDGACALDRFLQKAGVAPDELTLLFGALRDKNWRPMLRALAPRATARVYTRPRGRPAVHPDELHAFADGKTAPTAAEALVEAERIGRRWTLVTGSIYLVGEIRSMLLNIAPDPPVCL